MCKPIVVDNVVSVVRPISLPSLIVRFQVMIESGPTCWSEAQWWALEKALEERRIEVVRVKQGVSLQWVSAAHELIYRSREALALRACRGGRDKNEK